MNPCSVLALMLLGESERLDGQWEYYGYLPNDKLETTPYAFITKRRYQPLGQVHDVKADVFWLNCPPGAAG